MSYRRALQTIILVRILALPYSCALSFSDIKKQQRVMASAKPPVLICPAQFGTESDYDDLALALKAAGHPAVRVAPISRASWLRILPSALTPQYWNNNLEVSPALDFYLEALDQGVADLRRTCGADTKFALVGHSIGGWVMRGYLAERPDVLEKCCVAVTLGTPNRTPPEGSVWAQVDQTRGLLRNVNARWANLERKPRTVCVIGRGTEAGVVLQAWDENLGRSPFLEKFIALVFSLL